jgi:hypothetical protein
MCSESSLRSITVKKLTFSIAAAAFAIAGSTATFAAELPAYEANGFPVSPMQVRVLGAAHVQQDVTAPATTATVHQASVLTPRKMKTATVTTGSAR